MRLTPRASRSSNDGSVIIAMTIILVITGLAVIVMVRTLSNQDSVRHNQEFAGALAKADAGINDALFQVDQLGTSAPPATFCVGARPSCVAQQVSAAPGTEYVATRIDANHVLVKSRGKVNGVPHGTQATLVRTRFLPYAIFGDGLLRFKGNPEPIAVAPDTSRTADTATNHEADCSNGSPASHTDVYPGGQSNCPNSTVLKVGSYSPKAPAVCPVPLNNPRTPCVNTSPAPRACPVGADGVTLLATLDAGSTPYRCDQQVRFPPTLTVAGGVVEIYIFPPPNVVPVILDNTSANVNGDPTNLRVYAAGSGQIGTQGVSNVFNFWGVLYAPGVDIRGSGCQSTWRGAIVVNAWDCRGAPNLNFTYDTRVSNLVQDNWTVQDYKQIPSSQVVLP